MRSSKKNKSKKKKRKSVSVLEMKTLKTEKSILILQKPAKRKTKRCSNLSATVSTSMILRPSIGKSHN